jgi:YD repeat-containing protein
VQNSSDLCVRRLQGRLVTSSQTTNGASAQRRFAYDRWGNRTGMWDATSGGNEIQAIALRQSGGAPTNQVSSVTGNGAGIYTYDAAGNQTADGAHTYQYDGDNRLRTVDSATTASYAYDYQNQRFRKLAGGVMTHYVWDGGHVLAEHNGSTGAQIVDYVYAGPKLIGEGPGNVLGGNGTFTFVLADTLSTRVSLDKSANVLGRQAQLPFGEEFGESGAQEKHHFTNYETDPEIGSDYAVNRQYAEGLGRFSRVDPIDQVVDTSIASRRNGCGASGKLAQRNVASPQQWSRYAYTVGDPVNSKDPSGLFGFPNCPYGSPIPCTAARFSCKIVILPISS